MHKVAIIVLNWNGWKDTVACIKSLKTLKRTNCELQVIIVDNASTDDSIKQIKKAIIKSPNYTLVENNENLGFAGGNNVGINYALTNKADFVCVLNNDTEVDKYLIENFLLFFKKHKKAGVASPKIYFSPGFEFHKDRYKKSDLGKVIWYAGGQIDWANVYGSNFGVDEIDRGQFDEDFQTDFATGACLFIKSEVLRKVGNFDEKYYLYLEDSDLSTKVRKAGYEVWFVASAVVWHKVSQSSGIGSNLNDYFTTRNRLIFGMRYASLRAKFALAREAVRMYVSGRPWQKIGVGDYFLGKLGKGSWKNI